MTGPSKNHRFVHQLKKWNTLRTQSRKDLETYLRALEQKEEEHEQILRGGRSYDECPQCGKHTFWGKTIEDMSVNHWECENCNFTLTSVTPLAYCPNCEKDSLVVFGVEAGTYECQLCDFHQAKHEYEARVDLPRSARHKQRLDEDAKISAFVGDLAAMLDDNEFEKADLRTAMILSNDSTEWTVVDSLPILVSEFDTPYLARLIQAIDQCWSKSTNGQFSFSSQIKCGNTERQIFKNCQIPGWWSQNSVNPSTRPQGYFPRAWVYSEILQDYDDRRRRSCQIERIRRLLFADARKSEESLVSHFY